jgi:hypothetical protein
MSLSVSYCPATGEADASRARNISILREPSKAALISLPILVFAAAGVIAPRQAMWSGPDSARIGTKQVVGWPLIEVPERCPTCRAIIIDRMRRFNPLLRHLCEDSDFQGKWVGFAGFVAAEFSAASKGNAKAGRALPADDQKFGSNADTVRARCQLSAFRQTVKPDGRHIQIDRAV